MLIEIRDGFVGGLEKAERLRLQRQPHRASGLRLQRDEMGDDAQHVIGIARDHVIAGDPRLEAERRTLDRRRDARRADVGQNVGDVDGVLGPLLAAPVRLVDLLLDQVALEVAVHKGVGGVDVHVIVAEKFFQLVALGGAGGQGLRRVRRQPDAHAERLVAGDAGLDLRQISHERMIQLLPVVGGMHQRRIGQMAETVTEIHFRFPVSLVPQTRQTFRHPEVRAKRASKDAAKAPRPSPFEARRFAPSTSG